MNPLPDVPGNDAPSDDADRNSLAFGSDSARNADVIEMIDCTGAAAERDSHRAETGTAGIGSFPRPFGKSRLEGPLGAGGAATVFYATEISSNRPFAVKIPRLDGSDERTGRRIHRDALATSEMSHAPLRRTLDVGEIDGHLYLAMAFVDGSPLSAYVKNRGTSEREIAARVRTAADAIAYERGVIHLALKPGNVLVDATGELGLVDFGLDRRIETKSEAVTETGAALGTPASLSPEKAASAGGLLARKETGRTQRICRASEA